MYTGNNTIGVAPQVAVVPSSPSVNASSAIGDDCPDEDITFLDKLPTSCSS